MEFEGIIFSSMFYHFTLTYLRRMSELHQRVVQSDKLTSMDLCFGFNI